MCMEDQTEDECDKCQPLIANHCWETCPRNFDTDAQIDRLDDIYAANDMWEYIFFDLNSQNRVSRERRFDGEDREVARWREAGWHFAAPECPADKPLNRFCGSTCASTTSLSCRAKMWPRTDEAECIWRDYLNSKLHSQPMRYLTNWKPNWRGLDRGQTGTNMTSLVPSL